MTNFTGNIDVRQEIHLDFIHPITLAGFAAAAFYVKAETALFIAPDLGLIRRGKKRPDMIKYAGIGDRVRPGRPADRTLVDVDDLIDLFQPPDLFVLQRADSGSVEFGCHRII